MNVESFVHRRLPIALLTGMLALAFITPFARAQEDEGSKPSAQVKDPVEADSQPEDSEPEDPFALPEGADAEELFAFIRRVKMMKGRDLKSVMRAAKAATGAAEAIRGLDEVSAEDELNALREQIAALSFLQQHDPPSQQSLQDLFAALKEDTRPEFRKIGVMEGFKAKIASARTASEQEQLQLISEFKELIGDGDFDRDDYTIGDALARSISYSASVHIAASLYEDIAARMSESSDESLRERARE